VLAEMLESDGAYDLADASAKSRTFYRTLIQLIEGFARVGELERVPALFARAARDSTQCGREPRRTQFYCSGRAAERQGGGCRPFS
jgi:hypothetical protein